MAKSTAYGWRENDPEFDKAWVEALDEAADNLELYAHNRARDAEKPSDVLTIVLLKSLRPEKYRENYSFSGDLNVTGGLTLSAAIDEQITSKAEELQGAKRRLEAERQLPGPEFTEETPI